MNKIFFGVDIGGTTVKIGLYELEENADVKSIIDSPHKLSDVWEVDTDISEEGIHILPDIVRSISKRCDEIGIALNEVSGIGIGVPGPITDSGTVLKCANLGWGIFSIKDKMTELTGVQNIAVGNDANVAALGETWCGAGAGYKNIVMVTLGTGVGGGIVFDGKIHEGFNGAAAEIGHMTINPDETEVCGCGNRGCLEQYASATGAVRLARRGLKKYAGYTVLRDKEFLNARIIFDSAKNGDAFAIEIIDKYTDILGTALSDIAKVIAPDVILIGGGVSKAGDILMDNVIKNYGKHAMLALRDLPIKPAKLGNEAGMYGCIRMVIDK